MPKLDSVITIILDDRIYEEVYSKLFLADSFRSKEPERYLDIISKYHGLRDTDESFEDFEEFAKISFNSIMGESFSEAEIEQEIESLNRFVDWTASMCIITIYNG